MAWREQSNHSTDCYFYYTVVSGFNKKNAKHIKYPNLSSAIRPQQYHPDEAPPVPSNLPPSSESDDDSIDTAECHDDFGIADSSSKINQEQLDYFVRKLSLSKKDAYLAGTMLREFGVLAKGIKTTAYRHGEKKFVDFFATCDELGLVYCKDITGLMAAIGISCDVKKDWWLFIDGSISSLKAVLLHVENQFLGIPMAYSRKAKESYDTIKTLLSLIKYNDFQWKAGGDLKVIGFLTGMQKGYTKYCCFLCLWDSRARDEYYSR